MIRWSRDVANTRSARRARIVKYVAELAHVREVSLLGSADLGYWAERLRVEGLTPVEHASRARVLVVACDSKFFGVRFRELSFSFFVRRPDASEGSDAGQFGSRFGWHALTRAWKTAIQRATPFDDSGTCHPNQPASEGSDAAFLVQAFNSSRFFAWSERTWFSTPYRHGMIDVDVGLPATMRLGLEGQTVFSAVMSVDSRHAAGSGDPRRAREPIRCGVEGWNGPVFLPGCTRGKATSGRLFFAKMEGESQVYPFSSTDTLTLRPSSGSPILQALIDSHFVVDEWLIRRDATHAKSKTFRRMDGHECSSYKP